MLVNEILDKKVDYVVTKAESYVFKTRAKIGDRIIIFVASPSDLRDEWNVEFEEQQKSGQTTYEKTGSGHELEVFSMVKDSMLEFIKKYDPKKIYFSAAKKTEDDVNRAKLYDRLVKRFKVPEYSYEKVEKEHEGMKYFEFCLAKVSK